MSGEGLWDAPFVYPLPSGTIPSEDPIELDDETKAEVQRRLDEIRESHARAIVSARSYMVWQ